MLSEEEFWDRAAIAALSTVEDVTPCSAAQFAAQAADALLERRIAKLAEKEAAKHAWPPKKEDPIRTRPTRKMPSVRAEPKS